MKKLYFVLFLLFSLHNADAQRTNKPKMQAMYDAIKAAGIREPDFVMAQSIQETGWLNCKNCCLRYHNLFGFFVKGKCKRFDSDSTCIAYYKKWQDKRYDKWRALHPDADYFHFLKHVRYATGEKYNNELKAHLSWVRRNLEL